MVRKRSEGRDGIESRLLLYLTEVTNVPFQQVSPIKKGVWLAAANSEKWIVKEFYSLRRLKNQIKLTKDLMSKGFHSTYYFHPVHETGVHTFENRIIGIIKYIEASRPAFHYHSEKNRKSALQLINDFHAATSQVADKYENELHRFNQIEKWNHRLDQFSKNIQRLRTLKVYPYLKQYLTAGQWSLQMMNEDHLYYLHKPHCVLHGDLAHHNFIKGKEGKLYLIDFDLMTIGPKQVDLLQFCNRILPFIHWSKAKLFSYKYIKKYQDDRAFLAALVYPTDIFREWNFFLKADKNTRNRLWKHIQSITFGEYAERMQFSEEIKRALL